MIDNNGRSPKHIKTRLKVIVGPQSPNRLIKMQSVCFGLGGNRTFRPCVAVLRTEIFKAMVKNVHLLTCIYIKIALLKVGNNFLNKDFIFLQGRS